MNHRVLIGLMVAPLVSPIIFSVLIAGNIFISWHEFLQAIIPVAAFAIPISYAVEFVLGLPIFLALKKLKKLTLVNISALATLIPPLIMFIISAANGADVTRLAENYVMTYIVIGLCGLTVSCVFWFIAYGLKLKAS